jgi:hypothetical protein
MFERLGLGCFPKTSGSKGMQVYVPLNAPGVTHEDTKLFARTVAELLEQAEPGAVVSRMTKALRPGKVLVDWSQNDFSKTTVNVYSLRARERPTVSTPVGWDEVRACLDAGDPDRLTFDTADVLRRVEERGDLFAPVLSLVQELPRAVGDDPVARPGRRGRQPRVERHRAGPPVGADGVLGHAQVVCEQRPAVAPDGRATAAQDGVASAGAGDRALEAGGERVLVGQPGGQPGELAGAGEGRHEQHGGGDGPRGGDAGDRDRAGHRDDGGAGQQVPRLAGEARLRHERDEHDPRGARGGEGARGPARGGGRGGGEREDEDRAGGEREHGQRGPVGGGRLAGVRDERTVGRAQQLARREQLGPEPGGGHGDGERGDGGAGAGVAGGEPQPVGGEQRPDLDPHERRDGEEGERGAVPAGQPPLGGREQQRDEQGLGVADRGVTDEAAGEHDAARREHGRGPGAPAQAPCQARGQRHRGERAGAGDDEPRLRGGVAERREHGGHGDRERLERGAVLRAQRAVPHLPAPRQPRPRVVAGGRRDEQGRCGHEQDGGGDDGHRRYRRSPPRRPSCRWSS